MGFLAGKAHGQRSLEGYSPWGGKRVRHGFTTKQQKYIKYICIYVYVYVYIYIYTHTHTYNEQVVREIFSPLK